ncbi:hypothetical protein PoB_000607200 [Plakobranchus ocellatus]|uniref:Uncharacterized protein n=1 Tax=Plakobranchus ocellatus TaxID=259542 RepID=A0AAV3YBU6_9GAST|nr:hypothetical protein PoB_000607200 [Plakobranchus ocellatus]
MEAKEIWLLRRMMKTSWTEKKTNEKLLKETGTERSPINIRKTKTKFFGLAMRRGKLEHLKTTENSMAKEPVDEKVKKKLKRLIDTAALLAIVESGLADKLACHHVGRETA